MSKISRRDFLKLLPTVPLLKMAWPQISQVNSYPDTQAQQADAPNIIMLLFDTLSARHVSLYGYDRETTPNLARFAERATVFHTHHATANFTSPGTASLMTGAYPWTHRAFHLHGLVDEKFMGQNIFNLLPAQYHKVGYTHNLLVFSLLHQFRSHLDQLKKTRDLCIFDGQRADQLFFEDYSDAFWGEWLYFRGGATPPSSLFLSIADRGKRFTDKSQIEAEYGEQYPLGVPNLHSLFFLLEDAIDWIGDEVVNLPAPFFTYFHLLPPHEPYVPHRDYVNMFAQDGYRPVEKPFHFSSNKSEQGFLNLQRRQYDEFLANTDAEFGRLLDALESRGVLDNTYFIVTSDHGEAFERGIRGHVTPALYEPLVHIPLLISKPGQTTRTDVMTPTSNVDLLPTVLHLTGQPLPAALEGQILPTFSDEPESSDHPIFTMEAKSNPKQAALTKATLTIQRDVYKLIHYVGNQNHDYELYNLAEDPEELNDIYDTSSTIAKELKQELEAKLNSVNEPYVRV